MKRAAARGRATFDPDLAAVEAFLSSAPAMSHLEIVANLAVREMRATAPKVSGALSRSWFVRTARVDGRSVALVSTSSPYWHLAQYGSVHNSPKRYIDAALTRVGLPFTMSQGGEPL